MLHWVPWMQVPCHTELLWNFLVLDELLKGVVNCFIFSFFVVEVNPSGSFSDVLSGIALQQYLCEYREFLFLSHVHSVNLSNNWLKRGWLMKIIKTSAQGKTCYKIKSILNASDVPFPLEILKAGWPWKKSPCLLSLQALFLLTIPHITFYIFLLLLISHFTVGLSCSQLSHSYYISSMYCNFKLPHPAFLLELSVMGLMLEIIRSTH